MELCLTFNVTYSGLTLWQGFEKIILFERFEDVLKFNEEVKLEKYVGFILKQFISLNSEILVDHFEIYIIEYSLILFALNFYLWELKKVRKYNSPTKPKSRFLLKLKSYLKFLKLLEKALSKSFQNNPYKSIQQLLLIIVESR